MRYFITCIDEVCARKGYSSRKKGFTVMAMYISLALSDTMFPEGKFHKESFAVDEARDWLQINEDRLISAANPTHTSTIDALNRRFEIDLPVPDKAPQVSLVSGDQIMVFQARLPRLDEGEVHSPETVNSAEFKFSLWTID
jgi:hypothetical protein